ncbi:BatD family protein [Brachyspira pilosicoli]|uniref:Aerotolerance protein n=1 Tax=Brachyspira pilosicoli TaxID=52584 RepID=A0A5C8F5A6_BRAPL|nr:BatD family protein [Brachyspira pilosicoli]TXJ44689.1 aerotolerance protein [Brachyspira pilosicoli]
MIKTGKAIIAVLFLLNVSALFSQTTITAKLSDEKIGIGEVFSLSVTINNTKGKVTIPNIDGLLLRGTSQTRNMTLSGGTFKSIQTYSYTYVANRVGIYNIDNITVKIDNTTYKANPLTLEVVDEPVRERESDAPDSDSFDRFMNYSEDIHVENTINKTEVYLYEPIYIIQRAYTHVPVNVVGISKIADRTDFISYTDSSEYNSFTEIINGKRVSVIPLKKEVLYALKDGNKNIITTEFVFEKNNMFFDRVLYGEEEYNIKVLPLPDNTGYKNFSGGVGEFDFTVKANKTNLKIGEEVVVSLEVFGEGNTSIINMPSIDTNINKYFSVYQPKTYETNWFEDDKMMAKKTKQYVMVATNSGEFSLSNIAFCYFSPDAKSYSNVYSENISFNMMGGNIASSSFIDNNNQPDIINIKDTYIKNEKPFNLLNINIVYIYILILIIFSFIIVFSKKIKTLALSPSNNNNKESGISIMISNYNEGNREEYCKSVISYIEKEIKKKLNTNSNNIYLELKGKVEEEKIKEIKSIIDSCERELYSGNKSTENIDYHSKAIEIITSINKKK